MLAPPTVRALGLSLVLLAGAASSLLGCAAADDDAEGESASSDSANTSASVADLPDGTYRIPATSTFPITSGSRSRGVCDQYLDVYVVEKSGDRLRVSGGHRITTDPLIATGDARSGELQGEVLYDSCSYCRDATRQLYTMRGSLRYDGNELALTASYTGGWVQGRTWRGSIHTTVFGADEGTTGARHELVDATAGRLDGRPIYWQLDFARDAAGNRYVSLPRMVGDVPVWINGEQAPDTIHSCAYRAVPVSVDGAIARVGSNTFVVPDWFTAAE